MRYNWRVAVDSDGKVVSCRLADRREDDNGLIFYVYAKDTKEAGRLAFNAYMLVLTKARHAQYDREGRCRCGRERDVKAPNGKPRKRCTVCLAANLEYKERCEARKRGEDNEPRPRIEVLAERRDEDRAALRLETYRQVYRMSLGMAKPQLEAWLLREIEAIAGKERAA